MLMQDRACSLSTFFEIEHGQLDAFKVLATDFLTKTQTEAGCIEYAFSISGNMAHCCKGYVDADALLAQRRHAEDLLARARRISRIVRLEVYAPGRELRKLKGPMTQLDAQFFSRDANGAGSLTRGDAAPDRSAPGTTTNDHLPGRSAVTGFKRRRSGLELLSPLTQQELQVIRQMERGATNRQMSQCLFVTENTIKFHLKNIFCKLYVSNRLQALNVARDLGLVGGALKPADAGQALHAAE